MKKIRNRNLEIRNLEEEIISTLTYFLLFNYPPTFGEIYTFLKKKCSKRRLASILERMAKEKMVYSQLLIVNRKKESSINNQQSTISNPVNLPRYTLPKYSNIVQSSKFKVQSYKSEIKRNNQQSTINNFNARYQISQNKLNSLRFKLYIKFLSVFPQIKLIGLSGSVAMLNADDDHDVDLFVITAKNRLFTGRFIALLLAQIMGIRRKSAGNKQTVDDRNLKLDDEGRSLKMDNQPSSFQHQIPSSIFNRPSSIAFKDKVCLNLFFAESDLAVPKFKRSEYVAHEVLQMKPLEQKDDIYSRFIDANRWVFDIFPNAKQEVSIKKQVLRKKINNTQYLILNTLADKIESMLKSLQLFFIRRHQTTEIITDSQLWFHPKDFEKIRRLTFSLR